MTTPLKISSLDFEEIRKSLIDYLDSDQTEFKSYPFTGTALATLIDVLAYNTLYYGFYSNMIANESFLDTAQLQSNITALLKPLGYIVNGMNSSKLVISAKGTNTLTAYSTQFNANSGINSYKFYPIKNYTLSPTQETEITLYEAASIQTLSNINSSTLVAEQKYFINDPDVDINTIRIRVNGIEWERYLPTTPFYKSNDKIYFIDRTDEGFYILFSKYNTEDVPGLYGAQIQTGQTVELTYIKPTGQDANNATMPSTTNIRVLRPSGGGGRPDLSLIKTFVPKLFASAERAITKDDYAGLLLAKGTETGLVFTKNDVNVWGGDELQPPIYGRIFYSFNNLNYTPDSMKDITSYIKEKGILTIIPEYVPSAPLNLSVSLKYTGSANSITLLNSINSYYSNVIFNNTFSTSLLITELSKTFSSSALSSLVVLDATINFDIRYFESVIDIKTPINSITSNTFTYSTYSAAYLKSVGSTINLYNGSLIIKENVGSINGSIIRIDGDIISPSIEKITLYAKPTNKDAAITAKNQYLLTVNTTLTR